MLSNDLPLADTLVTVSKSMKTLYLLHWNAKSPRYTHLDPCIMWRKTNLGMLKRPFRERIAGRTSASDVISLSSLQRQLCLRFLCIWFLTSLPFLLLSTNSREILCPRTAEAFGTHIQKINTRTTTIPSSPSYILPKFQMESESDSLIAELEDLDDDSGLMATIRRWVLAIAVGV